MIINMKIRLTILLMLLSFIGYGQMSSARKLLLSVSNKPPLLTTLDATTLSVADCSGWSYPQAVIGSGAARINFVFFEPDLTITQIKITGVILDGMSITYNGSQIAVNDIIDFSLGSIIYNITAYVTSPITSSYKFQILTTEYSEYSDEVTKQFTFNGCL